MAARRKAITIIANFAESKDADRDDVDASFRYLKDIAKESGLTCEEIDELIEVLTNSKLSSTYNVQILHCLIPETKVSKEGLQKIIAWFFTEIKEGRLGKSVQQQFMQWLTGIVFYNLGDRSVVDAYYLSFFFLLVENYSAAIGKVLCLLTKPEDVRRWLVKQLLQLQTKYQNKAFITALLSIMKSLRPDVVPERIPVICFNYSKSSFDEDFEKAHHRNLSETANNPSDGDELSWAFCRIADRKSKNLPRLLPTPESISFESSVATKKEKTYSVFEFKSMASLSSATFQIEIPAQILSLLANQAGHYIITFSDNTTKARLSHKLYHTLFRVFLLEFEPYSEMEKKSFLNAIIQLEDYMHEGIPIVTKFLFRYLLIWDGEEFRDEILELLSWVTDAELKDLDEFVFTPIRQIFRSCGVHTKISIIQAMGKMIRNIVATNKREKPFFLNTLNYEDPLKIIEAVANFTSELITEGLIWSSKMDCREIMTAGLDFYNICQAAEQVGDLPTILLLPHTLVYKCLFSNSRLCLERLCSILVKYQTLTVQRLLANGVFDDFAMEMTKLKIYIMDCYRFLWNHIHFQPDIESYLFEDKDFNVLMRKFKQLYGENINAAFTIEHNPVFFNNQEKRNPEIIMADLMTNSPSVLELKDVCEMEILGKKQISCFG